MQLPRLSLSLCIARRIMNRALVAGMALLAFAAVAPAQQFVPAPVWTQLSPATSPPARQNPMMAYDAAHGQVLLFGGYDSGGNALGDTWTWDGTNWTQMSPTSSPSARYGGMLAYDAATGNVVLFGGYTGSGPLNDTWIWNGTQWAQAFPATSPSARYRGGMAYDAASGQLLLFGGSDSHNFFGDTWNWDGTTWTQLTPASSPSGRAFLDIAYDAAHSQIVIFAGETNGGVEGETWTWNGTTWTQQSPASSPPGTTYSALTFQTSSNQVLEFQETDDSIWLWNGSNWAEQSTAASPSVFEAPLAYDAATGEALVFGGADPVHGTTLNSTWALQYGPLNLGTANVCPVGSSSPAPCSTTGTVAFSYDTTENVTAITVKALTQGIAGLDFTDAGTGSCNSLTLPLSASSTGTCTVNVKFAPQFPGQRMGAVVLYDQNSSIIGTAPIYGMGTGPQVSFPSNNTPKSLGGGFTVPTGVAVDGAGNVYVANLTGNNVKEIPASCIAGANNSSCTINIGGGFADPKQVAVDGSGNVYVVETGGGSVKKIPPGCTSSSCVETIGSGINGFGGVAVDGMNNIYFFSAFPVAVKEFPNGCNSSSCSITLGGGFGTEGELAVDSSGDVYAIDDGNYSINRIPAGCFSSSCVVKLGGGFTEPAGVAVDASGNVYVGDAGHNAVKEIPASCISGANNSSCVVTLKSGLNLPSGIAFGGSGNLFVGNAGAATVDELPFSTPPSLSFAATDANSGNSSDSPQSVTASNIGNATLTFPLPTAAGTFNPSVSTNFSYDNSSTCTQTSSSSGTAFTLNAGQSCTVAIDFAPTATGSISGGVVLTDNSLNAQPTGYTTQSIGLSGTGNPAVTATTVIASKSLTVNFAVTPFTPVTGGGGTGTLSYSVSPTLPPALSMSNTTGAISGIPTVTNGATTYTVTVTDSTGATAKATFSLAVGGPVSASQAIASVSLQLSVAATPFIPVVGANGTSPYSYSISPALPAGLSIASSSGAISGTPTVTSASSSYTITVTDQNGATATASFSLAVQAPTTTVLSSGNVTLPWSPNPQSIAMAATVTSAYGIVNEGSATFDQYTAKVVGSTTTYVAVPVSTLVVNGVASDNYSLPAGMTVGTYSLPATYDDSAGIFASSSDSTHTLTITAPAFVVNTPADDPGDASLCTPQAAAGHNATDSACSLRDALLAAASAGAANISFDSTVFTASNPAAARTITLTNGTLTIPSNTTITGATSGSGYTLQNLVTVSGNNASTVFALGGATGASIANLTITGGNGNGGAIFAGTSDLTVSNCTLSGNTSSIDGGAIEAKGPGTLAITGSSITNNSATGFAGGVGAFGITLTVSDSTISNNTAALDGGGMWIKQSNATISASTISGNASSGNGGGIAWQNGNSVMLANTVVAGNSATTGPDAYNSAGAFTDNGGNLIGVSGAGSGNTGFSAATTRTGTVATPLSAGLTALGSFGGPTQTLMPLPGSAAICGGLAANLVGSTDQRGLPNTNAGYVGYSAATPCVDAGAVQTNYSLQFNPQPGNVEQYFAFAAAAPSVYLLESGAAFVNGTDTVSIPLALSTGPGVLSNGTASTSATSGFATYPSATVSLPGVSDQLTATLELNSAARPAPSISTTSNAFAVSQAVAQLSFSQAPPATLTAGGNAGSVVVAEIGQTPVGTSVISQANDAITLTVTGPNSYSKTYSATAVSGLATFDLSGAQLTAGGAYTYTASLSLTNPVTNATANESLGAAAAASVSAISGSSQSAAIGSAFAAPLKVLVEDQYSNPVSGATVVFTGPSSGAGASFSTSAPTAADGTTSVTATANGTASSTAYTVTASVAGVATPVSFLLTNTQAAATLTVTPSAASIVYGQPETISAAIAPASISGSTPGGTVAFYDGANALTPTSNVSAAAATYTVSVPTVGTHNYSAQYSGDSNFKQSALTAATLPVIVSKAAATISGPASTNLTYGTGGSINVTVAGQFAGSGIALPTGSVTYAIGAGAPQSATITAGAATLTVPAAQPAGVVTVTVSYAGDSNYNPAASFPIQLTVAPAALRVTASSGTMIYGGTPPAITPSYSGFVNGDGAASLTTLPSCSTTATSSSAVGSYPSTCSGAVDANYTIGYTAGSVSVGPAGLAITANNASRIYGTANPAFTGTVTGQQNGDTFTEGFSTTATLSSPVSTYAIVPSVTGANLSDYTQSVTNGTLTVTQAASTTTVGVSSTTITPGQSETFTATVASTTSGTPTGTVNFYDGTTLLNTTPAALSGGVASYSTTALAPGVSHAISAVYSGDTNFTGSSSTAGASTTVKVAPLDFVMTLMGPSSLTVVPGQSVSYQVQVTPEYGTYAGVVNFAMSGLPAGATVSFSPASVAANGGAQTVTITITTAPATAMDRERPSPASHGRLAPFAIAFVLLVGAGTLRKRGKVLRGLLCLAVLTGAGLAAASLSGCGSNAGFFAQSPQNYTVTLTATAGNLQHTSTITLNVQ